MNDYFDKIYVLSLKRNVDRRALITERLNQVGIDFEFFDACDGQVLNHLWKKLDNSNFTTQNYLACSISHLSIYNDALSRGFKRILILEDDIKPHKEIKNYFITLLEQIPEDYDLLYLGWIPLNDDCSMWTYEVINDRFISNNTIHAKNLWGLYAYSPSINLMKEMIELYNQSFPMEIDRYLVTQVQQQRKSIGIWPQLVCHDIMVSNNNGWIDHQSLKKSIDNRIAREEDYI
jgi:GR25 family glycosyltransferase involved in LPS biosynthesis